MKYIVANFKMNFLDCDFIKYFDVLKKQKPHGCKIIFCLPYTSLHLGNKYKNKKFFIGAQDMHFKPQGAYTGEISAAQISQFGIEYVIIGHSERRILLSETDETVNQKLQNALQHNFKVLLCCGETQQQKNDNQTKQVLQSQITKALKNVTEQQLKDILFVYEPVWSIGTGNVPTIKDIELAADIIKKSIKKTFKNKDEKDLPVLYGGSVNLNNYRDIAYCKGIDGLLIGTTALNMQALLKITGDKYE